MYRSNVLLLLLFVCIYRLLAADRIITGTIVNGKTGFPEDRAIVQLEKTTILTVSDIYGNFILELPANLKTISLIIKKEGFYTHLYDQLNVDSLTGPLTFRLYPGDQNEIILFHLGEIVVSSSRIILPEETETRYTVTRNDLLHLQALDLAKGLELLPGTGIISNNSLTSPRMPVTRFQFDNSFLNAYLLLGTAIQIDDIALSNHANMNLNNFTPLKYSYSLINQGVDLRLIPVENTERIEVYQDQAPAEYGDFSQSLVRVETSVDPYKKQWLLNQNAEVQNMAIQLGLGSFGGTKNSLFISASRDERDFRISGDEFYRIHLQYGSDYRSPSMKHRFKGKWFFTRYHQGFHSTDLGLDISNKSWLVGVSGKYTYYTGDSGWIENSLSLSLNRKLDETIQRTTMDPTILNPLEGEGSAVGVPSPNNYNATTSMDGLELSTRWKTKLTRVMAWYTMVWGTEWSWHSNQGKGLSLDHLHPPRGNTLFRSHSFNELPDMWNGAFFADFSGHIPQFPKLSFSAGGRVDFYNLQWRSGYPIARSGVIFSPRIRSKWKWSEKWQLRFGIGRMVSPPSLYDLHPRPIYYTVRDSSTTVQPIVSTYKFSSSNLRLKPVSQWKANLTLDWIPGCHSLHSLNLYYQYTTDIPRRYYQPLFLPVLKWQPWPTEATVIDTLFLLNPNYYQLKNELWKKDLGIEYTLLVQMDHPFHVRFQSAFSVQKTDRLYGLMHTYSNITRIQFEGKLTEAVPYYPEFEVEEIHSSAKIHLSVASSTLKFWWSITGFLFIKNYTSYKQNLILSPDLFIIKNGRKIVGSNQIEKNELERFGISVDSIVKEKSEPFYYYLSSSFSKEIHRGLTATLTVENFLDLKFYETGNGGSEFSRIPGTTFLFALNADLMAIF